MAAIMNPTQCLALPVFHAFTGCDTVSAFAGRGKKTAWATWKSFPEVTDAFNELLGMSSEVSEGSMLLLERFVVLMYDRTSEVTELNEARKQLFNKGSTPAAHQAHLLPGQHLEPGAGHKSTDSIALLLGLGESINWVAAPLDHSP